MATAARSRHIRLIAALASVVLAGCGLTGCGDRSPTLYPVQGQVVFADGVPVRHGLIEFQPPAGPAARGEIDSDGQFRLKTGERDGAVAGLHHVAIIQVLSADDIRHRHAPLTPVPRRYSSQLTTPLRQAVSPEPQTLRITVDRK
jgi:hypothetical protein